MRCFVRLGTLFASAVAEDRLRISHQRQGGAPAHRSAYRLRAGLRERYADTIAWGRCLTDSRDAGAAQRTKYRSASPDKDGSADATLNGTVTTCYIAPLTYDSQPGAFPLRWW